MAASCLNTGGAWSGESGQAIGMAGQRSDTIQVADQRQASRSILPVPDGYVPPSRAGLLVPSRRITIWPRSKANHANEPQASAETVFLNPGESRSI